MANDSDVKLLGIDAQEMQEWIESFDGVFKDEGAGSASVLLDRLRARAASLGIGNAFTANTPYVNTIPIEMQPVFPGDQEIERRIKSLIRWNALAMVVPRMLPPPPCLKSASIISSEGGRLSSRATPFISRGTLRQASMRAPLWKAGYRRNSLKISVASFGKVEACLLIRTRGSCLTSGNIPRYRWDLAP